MQRVKDRYLPHTGPVALCRMTDVTNAAESNAVLFLTMRSPRSY